MNYKQAHFIVANMWVALAMLHDHHTPPWLMYLVAFVSVALWWSLPRDR